MADAPAVPEEEVDQTDLLVMHPDALDLPEREQSGTQFQSRKTVYKAGEHNDFTYMVDEVQHNARLDLSDGGKIRLGRVVGRIQDLPNGTKKLIVTAGVVLDGEVIGEITDDGDFIPHDMYREPRYARWNDRSKRPHRINANQWVQRENIPQLKKLIDYLQANHGWQVIERPAQARNRETRDLFVARPPQGSDPLTSGVYLDAFEISVNPDYEAGFKAFPLGLDEQQNRWEFAVQLANPTMKQAALAKVGENIHFLGGVYKDTDARDWARPVDVGAFWLDGQHFPLYEAKGNRPLSDNLFADLVDDGEPTARTAAAPSTDELELPGGF